MLIVSYDDDGVAEGHGGFALAVMNTIVSGSAGGIIVLFIHYLKPKLRGDTAYWLVIQIVVHIK